jgi:Uma2 family endonuclease
MLDYDSLRYLPASWQLPDSKDTPLDNQLQHLVPGLLESSLALIWSQRQDWFFGAGMGIYYDPKKPAIVPEAFLSIGVPRVINEELRPSYVLWEEKKSPILALEIVSKTYREEHITKGGIYAQEIGILYYVIYCPLRTIKDTLEVYKLTNGEYILQPENPVFLPEIGLGIGKERGTYQGITRELLYWFDENGKRFLTPEERLQESEKKADKLAEMLKNLGVDPETII